jgi:hypothetical protein
MDPTVHAARLPRVEQTDDEIRVHLLAADGPVQAGLGWLAVLLTERDPAGAWRGCDSNFRLFLAQSWLWANREDPGIASLDRDETAAALALEAPAHHLWDVFAEVQVDGLRGLWPWIDLANLGVASRPRVIAIEYELVILAPTPPGQLGYLIPEGTTVVIDPGMRMVMHHVDGRWLVAGLDRENPPTPGWPAG